MSGRDHAAPLRVLQVLEATEGGTRRHLLDLCRHLDARRFTVSLACSARRDPAFLDDVQSLRRRGIAVHLVPMCRAIRPLHDAVALVRLVRLMRRGRYDVVHTHSAKAGFLGRVAARLAGVPRVVHTPHTFPFEMDVGPLVRGLYLGLERWAARLTDVLVCVCPSQRPQAQALVGPARTVVVENGTAEAPVFDAATAERCRSALGFDEGARVAGVIGRLTRQKGQLDFVAAARLVAERMPAARFLLVGDGALRGEIERAVAAAGLAARFVITGSLARIEDALAAMDVIVMPSLWEGLPYAMLEAMAAGKAVVATRVGGLPDVIVDGVSGLLVQPRDAPALAAAMLKVLENAEQRSTIGLAAQRTLAGRYRLDDMIERLEAVYEGRLPGAIQAMRGAG